MILIIISGLIIREARVRSIFQARGSWDGSFPRRGRGIAKWTRSSPLLIGIFQDFWYEPNYEPALFCFLLLPSRQSSCKLMFLGQICLLISLSRFLKGLLAHKVPLLLGFLRRISRKDHSWPHCACLRFRNMHFPHSLSRTRGPYCGHDDTKIEPLWRPISHFQSPKSYLLSWVSPSLPGPSQSSPLRFQGSMC